MPRLTAFMIVRDEEALLPRCLASLEGVADELVILDTGSADGTVGILERTARSGRFGRVHWARHEFRDFGTARRASLAPVATEWALWLDADEVLSPALRERLLDLKRDGGLAAHDGWLLNRVNRVYGRVMTGCKLGDNRILRLFRTGRGRFTESRVHEGIRLDEGCTVGSLDEPLYHDALVSWRAYLRKVDRYTSLDVQGGGRGFDPLHLILAGPQVFVKQYFLRRGFGDGWPGFVWSLTSAWSVTLRDWKRLRKALGRRY